MSKYNLITQRLLAEGWTADNHPDYVKVGGGYFGRGDPLDNFHGGFEYTKEYRESLTFRTGCGLLVKGSELGFGSMSCNGIDWTVENDCPVITCPLRLDECDKRFSQCLGGAHGGALCKIFQCDLRRTEEPYEYAKSIKKIRDEEENRISRELEQYTERVKGHVCHWHMRYDYFERQWKQVYDPQTCARMCMKKGGTCDLTHKELSRKRGNVFYDRKITRIHRAGDLFDGQEEVTVTKGIRFLDHPANITICEQIAKRCVKDIEEKERGRLSKEIFHGATVEIFNVRAEQRESRDLLQDLADLKAGIKITYAAEAEQEAREAKKEKAAIAKEKKIQKLEKKILEVGYDNLEMYSLDKIHADKWLTDERIAELQKERERIARERENEPKQMSLFEIGL